MEQDKGVEYHLYPINIAIFIEEQILLSKALLRNQAIAWQLKTSLESVVGLTPGRVDRPKDLYSSSILIKPVLSLKGSDLLRIQFVIVSKIDKVPSIWVRAMLATPFPGECPLVVFVLRALLRRTLR